MSADLVRMVHADPRLSRDPLAAMINAENAYRMLPLIIRSSGEYYRLQRLYPNATRLLRRLAAEMGKAHMGEWNGQL